MKLIKTYYYEIPFNIHFYFKNAVFQKNGKKPLVTYPAYPEYDFNRTIENCVLIRIQPRKK